MKTQEVRKRVGCAPGAGNTVIYSTDPVLYTGIVCTRHGCRMYEPNSPAGSTRPNPICLHRRYNKLKILQYAPICMSHTLLKWITKNRTGSHPNKMANRKVVNVIEKSFSTVTFKPLYLDAYFWWKNVHYTWVRRIMIKNIHFYYVTQSLLIYLFYKMRQFLCCGVWFHNVE